MIYVCGAKGGVAGARPFRCGVWCVALSVRPPPHPSHSTSPAYYVVLARFIALSKKVMEAYKELERVFTKLYRYGHLLLLADWDSQTMMPPKGAEARGAAMAELQVHVHGIITDAKVRALLEEAERSAGAFGELQR
ncbi:carboxypeptidase, partial [Trypanosoma conorhini]